MISPSGPNRAAPARGCRCHGVGRAARSSTPRLPMKTWFGAYVSAASQSRRCACRYSIGCFTSRSTRRGFEPRRTKLGACASTSETARTTGMPFGVTRAVSTRGISLDGPRSCQVAGMDPEGAVTGGGEPERGSEHAGEVRLIGEPCLARHVDQGPRRVDQVARQGKPPHEEIAMRARAQHRPELACELVARQPRDRLELRRVHGARALRVE